MFYRLNHRIVRNTVLLSLCFTLLIGGVSLAIAGVSLFERFAAFSEENAEQGISGSRFYIKTAESASALIAGDARILASLTGGKGDSAVGSALDVLRNTSYSIAGATLYATDGRLYTSRNISACPTLAQMAEDAEIGAFLAGDEDALLSVRRNQIAAIYNDVRYDPARGMVTYAARLRDAEGKTAGFLFSDISPGYLYDNFFSFDDYPGFQGTQAYIFTRDRQYLVSSKNAPENAALAASALGQPSHKASVGYYAVSKPLFGSATLVTLSPLSGFYKDFSVVAAAVAGATAVLNVAVWLIARWLARSVTVPLGALQGKMQNAAPDAGKTQER